MRKIFSVILIITMVFCFDACGVNSGNGITERFSTDAATSTETVKETKASYDNANSTIKEQREKVKYQNCLLLTDAYFPINIPTKNIVKSLNYIAKKIDSL